MKRILPALLIAASFSFATAAPADAGRLKEAARKVGEKVIIKSVCVADKLSGVRNSFFCR